MPRLWGKVIRNHRIVQQDTEMCNWDSVPNALTNLCNRFDVSYPVWMKAHENEFARFRRTAFLPEHFMEEVSFDSLEIEYLEDEEQKRRSKDPRNQF